MPLTWLSVFLLAAAVSFDSLTIGLTYGMTKISIPQVPRLLLSLISAVFLGVAMKIGTWLSYWISPTLSNSIGGVVLVLLGLYSLWRAYQHAEDTEVISKAEQGTPLYSALVQQPSLLVNVKIPIFGLIIQIFKQPLAADYDHSMEINSQEALLLGLAMSLDTFAAGIGAAILQLPPVLTTFAVIATNFLFLSAGLHLGTVLNRRFTKLPLPWLPGVIVLLLGMFRLIS